MTSELFKWDSGQISTPIPKLDDLATPDDNTDLNATISVHGLLPKLDNNSAHFLNGQGGWVTPPQLVGSPTDYTLTFTGTGISIGNGILLGRYILIGKLCTAWVQMIGGTTTNFGTGNFFLSLPFTSANNSRISWGMGKARKAGLASYPYIIQLQPNGNAVSIFVPTTAGTNTEFLNYQTPFTWASGDRIDFEIAYEIA